MKFQRYSLMLCVPAVLIAGCFSGRKEDLKAFTPPAQADVTSSQYILEPPDEVTVICTTVPELTGAGAGTTIGQTQTIRPDGIISFERVGEISVAGKTPRQVAEMIAERLASLYKFAGDNPVEVRVRNQSKYYYVIGQVQTPGAKIFTGRETTLSAISKAVPDYMAWEEQIQVIRPSTDTTQPSKIFPLNFKKMTEHGQMQCNVLLQEGDVIYVPPTILASIGLTMQEIVGPVLQGGAAARAVSPAP
jgi:polysaccharide export outer membrane protein